MWHKKTHDSSKTKRKLALRCKHQQTRQSRIADFSPYVRQATLTAEGRRQREETQIGAELKC